MEDWWKVTENVVDTTLNQAKSSSIGKLSVIVTVVRRIAVVRANRGLISGRLDLEKSDLPYLFASEHILSS